MDRSDSFNNQGGPLNAEIKAALYGIDNAPKIINYVYGPGGRDVKVENIEEVYASLYDIIETGNIGDTYRYLSVRDTEVK